MATKKPTPKKAELLTELAKDIKQSKRILKLLPARSIKRKLMKVGIQSMKDYQRKMSKKYTGK